LSRGTAVQDADGKAHCIVRPQTEITKRKLTEELLREREKHYRLLVETHRCVVECLEEKYNQAEQALQQSEQRFRSLVEATSRIVWTNSPEGEMRGFQPSWGEFTGQSEAEYQGYGWARAVHPDDAQPTIDAWQQAVANRSMFVFEHRVRRYDGIWRTFSIRGIPVLEADGITIREWVGVHTDITERKQVEEQLRHHALHDALTDLPNRAFFMDRLRRAVERINRHEDYLFAVLFLDLDRFKVVNDSLGHLVGDQLLIAIARRLEACLRPGDLVARLGGDEFTILLEEITDLSEATIVANRIQAELAVPFTLDAHEIFTNASIGITLGSTCYKQPEELLRDSDTAMYRAKALGKGRYEVFNTTMHAGAVARLQLENDLRHALERHEFQLYYQPILSLSNDTIAGFEALVRWQHPTHGLISPTTFIPLAEETGLIIPLGKWVLREACRQMREWQECPHSSQLTISVNLSRKQLCQPDLVAQIEHILQQTQLDAHSLKLEITESAFMENAEAATTIFLQLRALGVKLHMDDFGTGYSSLSYLHRFPVDMLKIDRSFVSTMSIDGYNSEIVQAIIMLAQSLGIEVTAEGVETAEQLAQLRTLGCQLGQGYFFSPPVESGAAQVLISPRERQGYRSCSALQELSPV
ncbi:MAG TPA: EAL domain-containing protein, partial [Candidatus Caenarcaniphilales bacterium]